MAGRPFLYDPELAARACEVIATTKSGARSALDAHPELPNYTTLVSWSERNVELMEQLAHARRLRLKVWTEDVIDIADDETLDPNDRKVRIATRQWLLAKEMARVYGDKLDVTSGGEAIAAPPHMIDARVQSIIMQAQQRAKLDVSHLPPEGQALLE